MPEFAPVLNVSTLNGTNGFRLDGDAVGDFSGRATAGGGDINGDGFTDLLIGSSYSDTGGFNRGLAWVVFGAASAPAAQGLAARVVAGTAYRFQGEAANDLAGDAISNAGDVNGDGFDDLIISAPNADPDAAYGNRGASYLVFGGAAKLEAADAADGLNDNLVALATLTPGTGFRFDGGANGDRAGWSVSGAGDVNGDGVADLLIGAPLADPNSGVADGREGASYIVFGGTNLTDLDDDDGTADGRIDVAQISAGQGLRLDGATAFILDSSGWSVAVVGDVNGDGFDDVLIGVPYADPNGVNNNEGAAYLVFGRDQSLFTAADLNLSALTGLEGTRFDGVATGDNAGRFVNGLGDVNGDGFADMVIGAPYTDPSGNSSGSAYVVFGRSGFGASSDLAALTGANGFRLDGLRAYDYAGSSVSAAGDVNGDGFDDILVGARGFDRLGASTAGAAYVVFGKASGFAAVIDLGGIDGDTGFRIEGAADGDQLGRHALGAAGDVNGDGFDDIIIGADSADNNSLSFSGSTYIIYGHRADTAVTRTGTALANTINGGKGADTISGLSGNDKLFGWEGDDIINGGDGNDTIDGGEGDDTIVAADGNDSIAGGEGTDLISAGSGADQIICSIGGDDDITGGSGKDTMDFRPFGASPINVDMALGRAILSVGDIMTFREVEQIRATTGNDTILGDDRNNSLLEGNTGNDTINGRGGADFIAGNGGKDTMTGGTGVDRFDFNLTTDSTTSAATRDIITDFKLGGELDKIDILTIDAIAGGGTSNDTFTFVTGAFTAAGQVRAVQSGADTIIELNTSGASVAEMTILLTGITATTITAVDFFL